ncbi:hypothetical protein N0V95_003528 [Ascochyta clinopodiicola]|nr:hypothetical protein N0V95_003528 [Ascochyta clinopodiicola]
MGTRPRFEDGFRRIAEATKMDGWDDPKVNILRLVRNWLCDESNGQWTMVVDNADDADVFFENTSQSRSAGSSDRPEELLSDYLPQSPNGSILITSRSRAVAQRLTGTYSSIIEVEPMGEDDALLLLKKKLGSSVARDKAVELVRALDFMPLALTQAAAFIRQREPRMSVSRYVDEINKSVHNQARFLEKDVGDSRRDGQASNSIIATWHISFEYIREHVPTAASLLSLMSMFDRQGIPESLLKSQYTDNGNGDVTFEDDIHTLSSFSLIKTSADGCEFEMHPLVQFSTKKWLELHNELEVWKGAYATLMDASYPVGEHEKWSVCRALFPHAQAMFHNQPEDAVALEAWASVLYKAAWYANDMGQYSKALELNSASLRVRESVLGAEHPDTLDSLNSLGMVLRRQGKYSEAERVHQRALEARQRVLGEDHFDTLTSMNNLALTYSKQGKWKAAEELQMQVMETRKKVLGKAHPDTIASMHNLVLTYSKQGQLQKAKELGEHVVKMRRSILGKAHPSTLTSMKNLAFVLKEQGRTSEAFVLMEECVALRRRVLGPRHPRTLSFFKALYEWSQESKIVDDQTQGQDEEKSGHEAHETTNTVISTSEATTPDGA